MKMLVLNGPNMNLLGVREPEVYGHTGLDELMDELKQIAQSMGVTLDCKQSNHEGALVDALHEAAREGVDGVILNAAAYSHTSVALRDAIAAVALPVVEVHMSNVYAREPFRHSSLLAPVCLGVIAGFSGDSYLLALSALFNHLQEAADADEE